MTDRSADEETSASAPPELPEGAQFRIADLVLDEKSVVRRSPDVEPERKVAIFDLLEENVFAPVGSEGGPYILHLAIEENRLVFDIRLENGDPHGKVLLSLTPFRRIIKDYFMICESYYDAIKTAAPAQIEAIDMGRRGLHNEGSETLKERLSGKIEMDFDTARRLFTLICVLHIKG
ncbi:MAG: UPF0262 family protein [Parvibaculum sp.]|uniref:UPF0262 family protein n=1 Tax=Parvibaculum sp. TaxID=2024848 RepID=UPI001B29A2D3|nr:UPF0262 family protein [Parvibaculum sp.]MBO6635498.1 UPF0262 family protein [Parvibaculum sp.]